MQKAPLQLHILVVGCGLGGLAAAHCLVQAGHRITLLEAAPAIGEVGAGIQVSPNVSRLLFRWGLRDALTKLAVEPEAIVLRRYSTGERIGYTRLGRHMDPSSEPYYNIHRADFHKLLYDLVAPHITLRLNAAVVSVDPDAPSVMLASGEVVHGDLIVGADGIKSYIQQVVLGHANPARATGDAVYRAVIPTEFMLTDPDLRSFVDKPEMNVWMGPRRHVVGYNIVSDIEYFEVAFDDRVHCSARASCSTWCSRTLTTGPSNRGLPRAVQTRCAQTTPIGSRGTHALSHPHLRVDMATQRAQDDGVRAVDAEMAPDGSPAASYVEPSVRPRHTSGRRVPSDACTSLARRPRVRYSSMGDAF